MLNDVGCTQEAPPSGCPASSCFPHNSIQSISLLRHHHFYRSGRNERLSHLNPLHTQQIVSRPRLQGGYILFCHWSDFFWRNSHRRFNLSFFFFFFIFLFLNPCILARPFSYFFLGQRDNTLDPFFFATSSRHDSSHTSKSRSHSPSPSPSRRQTMRQARVITP